MGSVNSNSGPCSTTCFLSPPDLGGLFDRSLWQAYVSVCEHDKWDRYVSTHDVPYWTHSFLQDLERACRDHVRRRCWVIGFGLGFRVIALDPNFRKLSVDHIVSAYKRTKNCAVLLNYNGTMMMQRSICESPNCWSCWNVKQLMQGSQECCVHC